MKYERIFIKVHIVFSFNYLENPQWYSHLYRKKCNKEGEYVIKFIQRINKYTDEGGLKWKMKNY